MMYFTPLKTVVVLGLCLLGTILCIPNLFPAPAAWMPWRTVHLGLDLRGGSYLLLELDMKTVIKERLDGLVDAARQALRPGAIFYQTLEAQPDQNRVLLRLRDAAKLDEALAALKPLVNAEGPTGTPDLDIASTPDGTVTLTLSPVALNARALGAVQQSIEIVRRRIDETGVVDPQIAQQGSNRIVVQLPGIDDPDRIKQLLGKTAHMTFQLVDEAANANAGTPPPPGVDFLPMQDSPNQKSAEPWQLQPQNDRWSSRGKKWERGAEMLRIERQESLGALQQVNDQETEDAEAQERGRLAQTPVQPHPQIRL